MLHKQCLHLLDKVTLIYDLIFDKNKIMLKPETVYKGRYSRIFVTRNEREVKDRLDE